MGVYRVEGTLCVTISEEEAARIAKEWLWNKVIRKLMLTSPSYEAACYEASIILEPFFKEP